MIRVGLVSPGDLGAAYGKHLIERGVIVNAALDGRSDRTRALADEARIKDVGDMSALVAASDLVISLVPPASALPVAREIVAALRATSSTPAIVDANSISPATAMEIAALVEPTGALFVDAAIVSTPPRDVGTTRIYASGPDVRPLIELGRIGGLDVRPLAGPVGRASALKMSYAALTKGFPAISTGLLVAAWTLGVYDELVAELESNQADSYRRMKKMLPRVPSVAGRWIGEMEEIARTFEAVGLTPRLFDGAADIYRFVAGTSLREAPETIDLEQPLARVVERLAAEIQTSSAGIEVLTPHAERFLTAEPRPVAARVATLRGSRLGFIENGFTSGGIVHEGFRASLAEDGITAVIESKKYWRPLEPAQLAALIAGTDAVVSGLCNTPPSTAWGVHDSIALERAGIPTVTLATAYYEELLAETATAEGMPDLRRVILPYPLEGRPEAEVRAVARAALAPLVAALTEPGGPVIARLAER